MKTGDGDAFQGLHEDVWEAAGKSFEGLAQALFEAGFEWQDLDDVSVIAGAVVEYLDGLSDGAAMEFLRTVGAREE